MNAEQLRFDVIRPVLKDARMWSQAAENLVLGTAAHESHCGEYVRQLGDGPARGIFQMEPDTLDDIYGNYLDYRADLRGAIDAYLIPAFDRADNLVFNLAYSVLMCRVHYYRRPEPLPAANDIRALGVYWKQFYNTALGKGTVQQFVDDYERFVGGA